MSEILKKESKKDKKDRKLEKKEKKKEKKGTKSASTDEPKEVVQADENSDKEETKEVEQSDDEEEGASKKDFDEIEIDLKGDIPLSKKQQRLLKKGKLDLEKLAKKHPAAKPELTAEQQAEEDAEIASKSKKSQYGVWIGNLSFETTKEDIVRFVEAKTKAFIPFEESTSDDDLVQVNSIDITRINLPMKERKIKGFAYLDLPSLKHVLSVVSLSESSLNTRKVLIKNSTSFEGRPDKETAALSKNPPSRILFVGNLSFDTTEDLLEEHFRFCGEIVKVRMATFEDTGKCKGFAFVDFKDEKGPTMALKSKLAKKFINRPLRLEFGEDRSKRTPNQHRRNAEDGEQFGEISGTARERNIESVEPRKFEHTEPREFKPKPAFKKRSYDDDQSHGSNKRVASSITLASAQRASAAIVPSSGKRTTFD